MSENGGFKLLAIRPLEGCDGRFLKNLIPNKIYQFYQNFQFEYENEDSTKAVVRIIEKEEPLDLYSIKNQNGRKIAINISAVVGENGSGKSSLIELLFVSMYLLAVQEKILFKPGEGDEDGIETLRKLRLEEIKKLRKKARDLILETHKKNYIDSANSFVKNVNTLNWNIDNRKELSIIKDELESLQSTIHLEIFYRLSNTIFKLKINPNSDEQYCTIEIVESELGLDETNAFKEKIAEATKNKKDSNNVNVLNNPLNLSDLFFYSIVLNYSQYALNSINTGPWINQLFHKNDGYQTPIVINPMRLEGNYNINRENELVLQRLLVNVLTPLKAEKIESKDEAVKGSLRELSRGHIAQWMLFKLIEHKVDKSFPLTKAHKKVWDLIDKKFEIRKTAKSVGRKDIAELDEFAREYILKKMLNMAKKYPPYYQYQGFEDVEGYIKDLIDDNSHITHKFFQTINFLKYKYSSVFTDNTKWSDISTISKAINDELPEDAELIQFIPPPIFKTEISFDKEEPPKVNAKRDNLPSNTLDNLSSGEKQLVYSISSIMYHLRYLDSVKDYKDEEEKDKKVTKDKLNYKYTAINIIFDEIELYYHPEFQRNFLNDLLKAIERCQLKSINNINCVFLTHSPFILSDIPTQNILRLEKNSDNKSAPKAYKREEQTFGGNIHDLLHNDFFLKDGFMGQFAKEKINDVITFLNIKKIECNLKKLRKDLPSDHNENQASAAEETVNQKKIYRLKQELEELKNKITINSEKGDWRNMNITDSLEIILCIGEGVVRNTLLEQYHEIVQEDKEEENQFLKKLANKLNYDVSKRNTE